MNITGNKRNADINDSDINDNKSNHKKHKSNKRIQFNETKRVRKAPKYIKEFGMEFAGPGAEYTLPTFENEVSPSAYQLENSEEGSLKTLSPEAPLKPLSEDYRAIYMILHNNNNYQVVDKYGQNYAMLYNPDDSIRDAYIDVIGALDGTNDNIYVNISNRLIRITHDMVKNTSEQEKQRTGTDKQINIGRANANGEFKNFNLKNKFKTYQKIVQQSGSQGTDYLYVVIELNQKRGGSKRSNKRSNKRQRNR
jgi:hypothetical protein